ncbi:MAG: hypothetical protein IJS40_08710, partial [Synergistaceae bacterium]|nr:hypothetical protein [Synergistaceae bacterium]
MKNFLRIFICLLLMLFASRGEADDPKTYYVIKNGTGNNDNIKYSIGNWPTSTGVISSEDKLADFVSSSDILEDGTVFYIASGDYQLSKTIQLNKKVKIYGGFKGTETVFTDEALNQRDLATNKTILNGKNDGENGFRVMSFNRGGNTDQNDPGATSQDSIIDGFVFQNGSADQGGGLLIYAGAPAVKNSVFKNNHAATAGGGICINGNNSAGGAYIENCVFDSNITSGDSGGGIAAGYDSNASAYFVVRNSTFINNVVVSKDSAVNGGDGGAVYLIAAGSEGDTQWKFENCTFTNNKAPHSGGLFITGSNTLPIDLIDCTFVSNDAYEIYIDGDRATNKAFYATNSIIWNTKVNNIIHGSISFDHCALTKGISVDLGESSGSVWSDDTTIYILANWTPVLTTSADKLGITHSIYEINEQESRNTALVVCIGAGVSNDITPAFDQLGNARQNPPYIGAVEGTAQKIGLRSFNIKISGDALNVNVRSSADLVLSADVSGDFGYGDIRLLSLDKNDFNLAWSTKSEDLTAYGLSFDNANAKLKVQTSADVGIYKVTVTATATSNDVINSFDKIITVTVANVAPVISGDNFSVSNASVNNAMTPVTIETTAGSKITWSLDNAPTWVSVASKENTRKAEVSATPSSEAAGETFKFKVVASNDIGKTSKDFTIKVLDIAPTLPDVATQNAIKGKYFSVDIEATAGTNIKWSYTGDLPVGLTATSEDKKFTVSGTPGLSTTKSYVITITASNDVGKAEKSLTINVTGGGSVADSGITTKKGDKTSSSSSAGNRDGAITAFTNAAGAIIASVDIGITASSDWNGLTTQNFARIVSVDVTISRDDTDYDKYILSVDVSGLPEGISADKINSTETISNNTTQKTFTFNISGLSTISKDSEVKIIAYVTLSGDTPALAASCDKDITISIKNPSITSLDVTISGDSSITTSHGKTRKLNLSADVKASYNDGSTKKLSSGEYDSVWTTNNTTAGIYFDNGVLTVSGDAAVGTYSVSVDVKVTSASKTASADRVISVTVTNANITSVSVDITTATTQTLARGQSLTLGAKVTENFDDNTSADATSGYKFVWSSENLPTGFSISESELKAGMNAPTGTHSINITATASEDKGTHKATKTATFEITITSSGLVSSDNIISEDNNDANGSHSRRVTTFKENDESNADGFIFASADLTLTTASTDFKGIEGVSFSIPVSVDVKISQDSRYYNYTSFDLSLD